MTPANTRSARSALDAVRPQIVRLDERRHPEDAAADLIEGWAGVETALRAMVGSSSLSGQALVSDVRAAGLLDYPHAHALLGFLAARDRATRPDYHPTAEDVEAARSGFQAIEAANGVGIAADTDTHPTPTQFAPPPPPPPMPPRRELGRDAGRDASRDASTYAPPTYAASNSAPPYAPPRSASPAQPYTRPGATQPPPPPLERDDWQPTPRGRRSVLRWVALGVLLLAIAGLAIWQFTDNGGAITEGRTAYAAGRREEARRAFESAAASDPESAVPHIYLGRLAREDGDLARATTELTTALQRDPQSGDAAREMGLLQVQANQPALAVRFFTRALDADPTDRLAAGGMACALTQQGNGALAERFFSRAGRGVWDACRQSSPAAVMPGAATGTMPAGATTAPGVAPR